MVDPRVPLLLTTARGFCRKTAPAYVQACCVFRGISATNVGVAMYLDHFDGSEVEKVNLLPS